MPARPIIIDTDPGQDDAVAILMALASPELEVLGLVACAGNVPLALTQRNVRQLCELAGRPDVPVFAGCPRPMVRPLVTAEYIHGASGLDGANLPEPTMALQSMHGVDFLVDALGKAAEPVTVCMLGPMTNLAMALVKAPDIARNIREVVFMGGGYSEGGNVTPAAEFNIYVDPHAAHVVLTSGVPVTMFPLDLTHQVLNSRARIDRIRALGTPVGDAVAGLLSYFREYDSEKYGTDGSPLHDPCVIGHLLKPELFGGKRCHVAIETASETTMGMTVVDWWGVTGKPANCSVMRRVDAEGFYDLVIERLSRLKTVSPVS